MGVSVLQQQASRPSEQERNAWERWEQAMGPPHKTNNKGSGTDVLVKALHQVQALAVCAVAGLV